MDEKYGRPTTIKYDPDYKHPWESVSRLSSQVLRAYEKLAWDELFAMPVFPPGPPAPPRSRWWKFKYRWRRRLQDWLTLMIDWLEALRRRLI